MNLLEQLDCSYWKILKPEDKRALLGKVLMYFVNPLLRITDVELKVHELYGVKSETYELNIAGEPFIFIPGNKEAILGWDIGTKGLSSFDTTGGKVAQIPAWIAQQYQLADQEDLANYVNDHTSALRKVAIPPMLVQRRALPFGTEYLGVFDTVTGEFSGDVGRFSQIESDIRACLMPKLTLEESLSWSFPEHKLESGSWFIQMAPETNLYEVYKHEEHSFESLRKKIRRKNFDFPTEDQWEYIVGAGTRRLFRWGDDLAFDDPYRGGVTKNMSQAENMFGLTIDATQTKNEVLENSHFSKLTHQKLNTGIPVVDYLPLATYYHETSIEDFTSNLSPNDYLYRKIIPVVVKDAEN